jgi:hypothetical protein
MNRFLFFSVTCLALISISSPACEAIDLPDIPGWTAPPATILPIDPASKDKGAWIRRRYEATSPVRHIDVHLLTGSGPNSAKAGTDSVDATGTQYSRSDFPVGFGATYDRTRILELEAVVEDYPYVGVALSLRVSGNETLVLESAGVTSADLIRFAGEILPSLR